MSTDRYAAVSVAIGGSGATVALIDTRGRILYRTHTKSLWGRPALATLEPYLRAIETALSRASDEDVQVAGIGVSIPGTIDAESRRPLVIASLPSLNGFPLSDLLETRYGFPARLHVDVDAALLGEQHFGAGKGFQRILYLTVNTVVGAAFVTDAIPERAIQQYTGHICHLLLTPGGPRCSCGKRGCINTLLSLSAVQKMVQRALRRSDDSSLARRLLNHEYLSLQLLAEEAEQGDDIAVQVYREFAHWLTIAIEKYLTLLEPHIVILGGAMVSGCHVLLPRVHQGGESNTSTKIVSARLGDDAVLAGAVTPLFACHLAS